MKNIQRKKVFNNNICNNKNKQIFQIKKYIFLFKNVLNKIYFIQFVIGKIFSLNFPGTFPSGK